MRISNGDFLVAISAMILPMPETEAMFRKQVEYRIDYGTEIFEQRQAQTARYQLNSGGGRKPCSLKLIAGAFAILLPDYQESIHMQCYDAPL
ncbi:hypothetical protein KQ944_09010 [Bacillus subtilis]|uniref:hypothetical protein n=1 Tax=Pseudochrobactrum asaccharolyticum TaxID=354351 RepID=UPI001F2DE122|nr:hypothetical protein [Pseudochrobactrum asaccharolyticum]MCF7644810.1 hypothetical protein [Pseudochrobactrum asaccharolyticum]MCF7671762.1 hypothetical protein [Bacillus subtilis]